MPTKDIQTPWHALEREEALNVLHSDMHGLTSAESARRLQEFGLNILPEAPTKTAVSVYISQFKSAFIYLLLAASLVSMVLGEYGDALFIFLVLQINAVIGTFQEWKAHEKAEALKTVVQTTCLVLRDGQWQQHQNRDLVPGDVVRVVAGMTVPAAVRALQSDSLEVDESLLTGESLPVSKDATVVVDPTTPLAERANFLHAGTTVLRGQGVGVVCATGAATEVGQVALALGEVESVLPPLIVRMRDFTRKVSVAMVGVIVVIALVELARGAPTEAIFMTAVALAVAAIPEGLPVAMTVALSVSVTRMAHHNVVVRRLAAVEGLGSCTLIAADKTGTLTKNKLSVSSLFLPTAGLMDIVSLRAQNVEEELRDLMQAVILCNEAELRVLANGEIEILGDTVDGAFLRLAHDLGFSNEKEIMLRPRVGRIPYDSANAYAASYHESQEKDGSSYVFVKGAPEVVLPMCQGADAKKILKEMDKLAKSGCRVLAAARGTVPGEQHGDLKDLKFLGLLALIDPLRPSARSAVNRCHAAGVAVRMITGDHPLTALAIGRELGLAESREDVLTGEDILALEADHSALDAAVLRTRIFARISPMQKLVIVKSMQRAGHVVAVTGDGVNDAPALAAANIGAAMGKSGTDIARSAADLILTDDRLESLAEGIGEGRIAYDNIRKVIYFLISTGAAEIVLFMLSIAAGLPLPLTPVQLLWLNLVTSGIQDVTLAFEKGEPNTMTRAPRPPEQGIFDRRMLQQLALSGSAVGIGAFIFFNWSLDAGWSTFEASNMLLLMLVMFENAHVFNCRSELRSAFRVPLRNNRWLIMAVLLAQGLHIMAMHIPWLAGILDIAPVGLNTWLLAVLPAVGILVLMEIYKLVSANGLPASAQR